jgi:hypothetical protein
MVVEESEGLICGERGCRLVVGDALGEEGAGGDVTLQEHLQRGLAFGGVVGLEQLGDFGGCAGQRLVGGREERERSAVI